MVHMTFQKQYPNCFAAIADHFPKHFWWILKSLNVLKWSPAYG